MAITGLQSLPMYYESAEEAKIFWIDKIGFELIREDVLNEDEKAYHVKSKDMSFDLVLYSKHMVPEEVRDNKPSLLFETDDIYATHADYKKIGLKVLDVEEYPGLGKTFAVFDQDDNAYAICEKKKEAY